MDCQPRLLFSSLNLFICDARVIVLLYKQVSFFLAIPTPDPSQDCQMCGHMSEDPLAFIGISNASTSLF